MKFFAFVFVVLAVLACANAQEFRRYVRSPQYGGSQAGAQASASANSGAFGGGGFPGGFGGSSAQANAQANAGSFNGFGR